MWSIIIALSGAWLVSSVNFPYQSPEDFTSGDNLSPPIRLLQTDTEVMVELTNNLGVAILKDHSYSNGNFAFSPYGVASVLVVLYEGARGDSAVQIQRAFGLPWNKDSIRVGFGNIHRHLRSYFSHEGYLSGMSLNKDQSSLKPEFKKILRIYGYDVELDNESLDNVASQDGSSGSGNGTATTTAPPTASSSPPTPPLATESQDVETTTEEQTTKESNLEQFNETTISPTTTTPEKYISGPSVITTSEEYTSSPAVTTTASEEHTSTPAVTATAPEEHTSSPVVTATTYEEHTSSPGVTTTASEEHTSSPGVTTTASEEHISTPAVTTTAPEEHTSSPSITTTASEEQASTTSVTTTEQNSIQITKARSGKLNRTILLTTATAEENLNSPTTSPKEETSTPSEVTDELIILEYTVQPTDQTELSEQTERTEQTTKQTERTEQTTEQTERTEQTTEPERTGKTERTEQTLEQTAPPTSQPSETIEGFRSRLHISLTIDSECTKIEKRTGKNCSTGNTKKTNTPKPDTNQQQITPESISNEISKLDNKMLIPQPEDYLTLTSTGSTWTQTSKRNSRKVESLATAVGVKSAIEMSRVSKRQISNVRKILSRKVHLWTSSEPRNAKVRQTRTITDYLKRPETGELSLQLQNGMYDTQVSRSKELYQDLPRKLFLVDGVVDIPVPMMSYTYIFPYAYLPNLQAKAMEFPLDDARYKLLIILPTDRRGLRNLISDLMSYPLGHVLDSLRPAKVKATIPTFMVEGFVILTSSLKTLGIRDVFDPRKANLSGMSLDPELYVRNIEQSVTVLIRNYVEILDIETRTMAARYIDYNFEATHPFLYFVLDTATNVALMAGQMLDPLNSRIY